MLDIKYIREHKEEVAKNNASRNVTVDLDAIISLDDERVSLQQKADELRAERNKRSKTKPSDEEIALIRKMGDEIGGLEALIQAKEDEVRSLLKKVPNRTHPDVPIAKDESGNVVLREVGTPTQFSFQPKEHWQIAEERGMLDLKKAAEVSGSRFTYIKGKLVLLQVALMQYAFSVLSNEDILKQIIADNNLNVSSKTFEPILPPVLIKPDVMDRMARLEPREERYHVPGDDLYLVGSAEHTLGPLHMDEVLPEESLPIRYIGYSTSFRREAGTYGKDMKGTLRVHQFDKMEIESFSLPENSLAEQDFIVAVQEYLMQSLKLPYRVMAISTGDMGTPDYRQIDIETWLPGQNKYRETHTSDLNTDYQARRLNTKVKRKTGQNEFVHMNDATLFAFSRLPIAIVENYQQEDGTIVIPEVLRKYTGFDTI